eukprot:97983-Rhodomonas_salina.1
MSVLCKQWSVISVKGHLFDTLQAKVGSFREKASFRHCCPFNVLFVRKVGNTRRVLYAVAGGK